jgi:hypothetical protein
MLRKLTLSALLLALPGLQAIPHAALAQEASTTKALLENFNPEYILSDDDIFDVDGMSYDRMVAFLRAKGTLADTKLPDIDGVVKPVPDIIWRVARAYKVNPKYLLALLQKEQSLVEDPDPSQKQFDWATGYAICDNCSKNDPAVQEFKGFASQVEWAAKQHREKYFLQILATGTTKAGKAPGKPITINGQTVVPRNAATAMLYAYTPHINGNRNLWIIWQRWYAPRYPDGTVVKAKDSGKTYLIRLGEKRPFASRAVFESLADPKKTILVSDTELAAYPTGAAIKFPKFALVQDEKKSLWLLSGDDKREIESLKTFRKLGFNEDEIVDVKAADIADYAVGKTITAATAFAQGTLLQDKTQKSIWYVEAGEKHKIADPALLKLYFPGRSPKAVTTASLDAYKTAEPYALHDGELVRGAKAPAVFVMENGVRRPIPSADIFETMGWKWSNVATVADAYLQTYPVGAPVDMIATPAVAATTPASSTQLGAL